MANELLFLDPPEIAPDRAELPLHDDAIQVAESGPDWGDAAIEAYLADTARGSVPVDFRVPNRTVQIPLLVGATETTMTFDQARAALQQKAALLQREGGWLKRVLRDGRAVYLDVVDATLKFGGGTLQAQRDFDPDAALTLTTLPDWYGQEENLGAITSAPGELVFTLPGVPGDYPARARLVVTDASGQPQRGLLWGLRSRHYSTAPTARLVYQAEALTPLDTATAATVDGQAVIRHPGLSTDWTPVLSTEIAGSGNMTHTGAYRVWARVHTTAATPPRLQLLWDVGDFVAPVPNPAVAVPGSNGFYLVNLGAVRLDPPPVGPHRWQGAIQAAAAVLGDDVSIDRLWFFPVDEGYGELSAPPLPDFAAWLTTPDAVINADRVLELRTGGMFRQAGDGIAYGQVSHVIGDLPRLPPAGLEDRVCEVILKPSRGVPGVDDDPATDSLSAHVYARPCWLFVPAS